MNDRISRFEELIGWQKGRSLVKSVYQLTYAPNFARDYALSQQIRRAAISIPSNLAEGFERDTLKEFHHFTSISKGSCAEVRTQLYLALDLDYIDEGAFSQVMRQAEETGRVIGGLRASLSRKLGTRHSALGT